MSDSCEKLRAFRDKSNKKKHEKISESVSENRSEKHESFLLEKKKLKRELLARRPLLLCSHIPFCLSTCDVGTPLEIEEALKEYENVFPQELPYEHHIDLVPSYNYQTGLLIGPPHKR